MSITIDERAYDHADQERFATLSGDRNPIHLDAVLARREIFGDVVVHGLHLVLRALDAALAARGGAVPVALRGSFPNPAFLNEPVTTRLVEEAGDTTRLAAESGGLICLEAAVTWAASLPSAAAGRAAAPPAGPAPPAVPPPATERASPRVLAFDALAGRSGELDLWLDAPASARAFPRLHALLGAARMAELCALTRLVGMECPGLRSIFYSFDLRLAPEAPAARALSFAVERVVARASFVRLRVGGGGLTGTLDTSFRPPPHAQASCAAARAALTPGELADQRALVVGGSRGLGEATAKLVAAGGGAVLVTYLAGRADAERVAAEIGAAGGRCDVLRLDVRAPADLARTLAERRFRPTHLYYFASPKIFVKRAGPYDDDLRARFAAVYVEGLAAVVEACRAVAGPLRVFVPSTTALDAPVKNLEEYADAKAAAEARALALAQGGVEVMVRRLPRVATDQTVTLVRHPAESALDIMTSVVREMSHRHG